MRWWWKLLIAFVFVVIIVFLAVSVYLGYSATKVERVAIEESPADLGLTYQDIEFTSQNDNLTLRGWFLPSDTSERIIIIVHGSDMHRADPNINTLGIAAELVGYGYNVLMFDLRGHGESDGDRLSAGYHERKDLHGAVKYVTERGFEKIGVLGFSMGAATALMTAAENNDVDCVVSDSCFADITDIMGREFKSRTGFPEFFLDPVLFMVKIMYGVDFKAVRPVDSVADISPRLILFIHGENDDFVLPEHSKRLYQASGNTLNRLWIVPKAGHVRSYTTNPEEYIGYITGFFESALE